MARHAVQIPGTLPGIDAQSSHLVSLAAIRPPSVRWGSTDSTAPMTWLHTGVSCAQRRSIPTGHVTWVGKTPLILLNP
jgi:hypothetical protein